MLSAPVDLPAPPKEVIVSRSPAKAGFSGATALLPSRSLYGADDDYDAVLGGLQLFKGSDEFGGFLHEQIVICPREHRRGSEPPL